MSVSRMEFMTAGWENSKEWCINRRKNLMHRDSDRQIYIEAGDCLAHSGEKPSESASLQRFGASSNS
jgi:hypothetical protein